VVLGNERACAALLAAGAAANARDRLGFTPLHLATWLHHNQAVAAAPVDRGADVNARDKRGGTPLHGAVCLERLDAVRLLLGRGADPHAADYYGASPLDLADPSRGGPGPDSAVKRAVREAFLSAGRRAEGRAGTALWAMASLMNHCSDPTAAIRFVSRMAFVTAGRDLWAGEELMTSYSANRDALRQHWGIVE
jgi:hypothetical protein